MNAHNLLKADTNCSHPDSSVDSFDVHPNPGSLFEQAISLKGGLPLSCGLTLPEAAVGVRMLGPADGCVDAPADSPVVAVLGGISASRYVVSAPGERGQGWWQNVLGPDGVDATARYRVLGIDWLGAAPGTGSAATSAQSDDDLPPISTLDQARMLSAVLEQLGIDRLDAIVSASFGGMVAQHFAAQYPQKLDRLMVIACAHTPDPMAVARRLVQKQILELAADEPDKGVALARALAMTSYRSAEEFRTRFAGPDGQARLASYLAHQGQRFARRFSQQSYRRLMDAIDGHQMDPRRLHTPLSLLGFETDELCPPALLREFAARLPRLQSLEIIQSHFGHDGFLCEQDAVARAINSFLEGESS